MITANALQRTIHVLVNDGKGTAFLLDHLGRQYLVTATHVIGESSSGDLRLEVMHDNCWKQLPATVVGHANHGADISVITLPFVIAARELNLPVAKQSYLTQDAYFLGFPFGEYGDVGVANNGFPMPFVKRAMISSFNIGGRPSIVYLDGHNNLGFSGGPVVINNPSTGALEVLAVVSGYRGTFENVQNQGVTEPDLTVSINSGIIVAYNVLHAIDVIEANPIGALLE